MVIELAFASVVIYGSITEVLEYADDHKPRTTFEKHIKFEEFKAKNRNRKVLNVNEKYLVKVSEGRTGKYQVSIDGYKHVIGEPIGWEDGKLNFDVRFVCNQNFDQCHKI